MRFSLVINSRVWPVHKQLDLLFLLFLSLILTIGCASSPGTSSGSRSDIVTDSDEPESRKRARIRMELAVGYFELGQITVALDEVKLALNADPNFADAFNLRGLVYMRLNDQRLAEESFRRALALSPRDPNVSHNFGWLLCQQARYAEASLLFSQAISNPSYGGRAKTWLTQGLCQMRNGQRSEAEFSLIKSYELDAGNPLTGYNLASLLFQRGDFLRSQFYIRRLNNTELANAESYWLGIKVERRMDNPEGMQQLALQLKKRFPQSRELISYERGAFDE
jgi:type IV pilus assembly protein PilF